MPGYIRTPFFSAMSVFNEQPPIAALISTDTAQTIPSNVVTALTFATPINVDPLNLQAERSLWDAATPGQFTISIRGFYLFGATVRMATMTPARWFVQLNSSSLGAIADQQDTADSSASAFHLAVMSLVPCLVGDVLTVSVLQASGGDVDTSPAASLPNMWIVRVG